MKISRMIGMILILLAGGVHAQEKTLKVWMDDIELTADGKTITYLTVYEHDDMRDYMAFDMRIRVPEGVSVGKVKSGREWVDAISLSDRATSTHAIYCRQADPTTLNIFAESGTNQDFYNDDLDGNPMDELFTVGLVADPSMFNGHYEVEVVDIKFVYKENGVIGGVIPDPISFGMSITGGREASSVEYTLTEAGYGTLILPFDAELPEGLTAYTCTAVDGATVVAEPQTSIRANVPLLMQGTPGTYVFRGFNAPAQDSYTEGVLTGVYTPTTLTNGYVLQNQNGVTGFYPVREEAPVTVPVNRCFLQYDMEYNCLPIRFGTTGVSGVEADKAGTPWFDLQGRRVQRPQWGVYIRSKEKIIVK